MFSKTCLLFVVLLFNLAFKKPWSEVKCLDKPGLVKKLETIYLSKESIKCNSKHGVIALNRNYVSLYMNRFHFMKLKNNKNTHKSTNCVLNVPRICMFTYCHC